MNHKFNESVSQSYYGAIAQEITDKNSQEIVNMLYKEAMIRNLDGKNKPLGYYDYIQYEHRTRCSNNPYSMFRIGDCCFEIPPEYISIMSKSESINSAKKSTLNQSTKGKTTKEIFVQLTLNGLNQINGYPVESPFDFKYYVDGLRSLICQFKYTPFIAIENKVINDANRINNVALKSLSVETVEGFSQSLKVQLVMDEFNIRPYINENNLFLNDCIDWDLYRFYIQKNLNNRYISCFKKIKTVNFTNEFKFMHLNLKDIDKIIKSDTELVNTYYNEIISSSENVYLTYIKFNLNNTFSSIKISSEDIPTKQYLGFSEIEFTFIFKTSDESIVQKFNKINNKSLSSKLSDGIENIDLIKIENELVNLTGTEFVILNEIQMNTVPEFPELYDITVKCIGYDMSKVMKMKPIAFRPFDEVLKVGTYECNEIPIGRAGTEHDFIDYSLVGTNNKITQDICASKKLMSLNMYPNFNLPKYNEIDDAIEKIRSFRFKNGIAQTSLIKYPKQDMLMYNVEQNETYDGFVEPDFYIIYPLKSEYTKINKKLVNIKSDTVIEPEYKYGYEPIYLDESIDVYKYESLDKDCMKFKNPNSGDIHGDEVGNFNINLVKPIVTCREKVQNNPKEILEHMLVDEYLYSQRGTLIKAFPNFIFMICDESIDSVEGSKSWTNYYIYKSIIDIQVTQEINSPVSNLKAIICNDFKYFSSKKSSMSENINTKSDILSIFNENQFRKLDTLEGYKEKTKDESIDEILRKRNILNSEEVLKEGSRVHIRMGYGSNPSKYPTVFNGTITEVNTSKNITTIEAKSDGLELINTYLDEEMNILSEEMNLNKDASNIILDLISKRDTGLDGISIEDEEKIIKSKYGIEHFGIYKPNVTEGYQLNQSDIAKNIYLSNYKGICLMENYKDDFISESMYEFLPVGKKVWDICKMSKKSMPEFIVYPRTFLFEHRLFFGLPIWMCKYNQNKIKNDIHEYSKTFSQVHIIDFNESIIDNNIIVDNKNLITNVKGIYNVSGFSKSTPIIMSDCHIDWAKQRLKIVDNSSIQNFGIFSKVEDENLKYVQLNANNKHMSIKNCISELQDLWKEAYNGELIIIGKPQINSYDLIALNDPFKEISGICLVKCVTHSINLKTGFTTSITPGLLTTNTLKYSGISNVLKSCNKMLFSISDILNSGTSYNQNLLDSKSSNNILNDSSSRACKSLNNMLIEKYDMFNYKNSIIIHPLYKI